MNSPISRLGNMNRGVFFLLIVVFFVLVGVIFGVVSALVMGLLTPRDSYGYDDMIIMCLFAPPGIATAAGVVIGTIAAAFYKPLDLELPSSPPKPEKPPVV